MAVRSREYTLQSTENHVFNKTQVRIQVQSFAIKLLYIVKLYIAPGCQEFREQLNPKKYTLRFSS